MTRQLRSKIRSVAAKPIGLLTVVIAVSNDY